MYLIYFEPTYDEWVKKAREAIYSEWDPQSVHWEPLGKAQGTLNIFEKEEVTGSAGKRLMVPKRFIEMANLVARHSAEDKWALLYRVLWRLSRGERSLLEKPTDKDAIQMNHYHNVVKKDAYRITAFLRFREINLDGEHWHIAWYEPEHDSLTLTEGFFRERFYNMRWSILTPAKAMHWDGKEVTYTDGVGKPELNADGIEQLWVAYYSNIFNPARVKVKAMQAQLLKRNWKNLPEAVVIEPLIRGAAQRVEEMIDWSEFHRVRDSDFQQLQLPQAATWEELRTLAKNCRACPLWKLGKCTVFGVGPLNATMMVIGEQPGEQENEEGEPFVGPAGKLLNQALATAGINRSEIYLTNAVKHFKYEPRGKRRVLTPANAKEIAACRPWLEAEVKVIRPKVIIALGRTAGHALLGTPIQVLQERGAIHQSLFKTPTLVTVHPSYLLRLGNKEATEAEFAKLVSELRIAKAMA